MVLPRRSCTASARALFAISLITNIGDGRTTDFWTDRWLQGQCIADLEPALMPFVRERSWRKLKVTDALQDNKWMRYIEGGLSVVAIWQFLQLCEVIHNLQELSEEPD